MKSPPATKAAAYNALAPGVAVILASEAGVAEAGPFAPYVVLAIDGHAVTVVPINGGTQHVVHPRHLTHITL